MPPLILPKIGMVFGVFDGLHPGHQFFLRSAASRCQNLVVVVALPEIVEMIKKHRPKRSFTDRVTAIQAFDKSFHVVPSDSVLGTWQVLRNYQPDILFLGYDQEGLAEALSAFSMPQVVIDSHYPEKYKSGLINVPIEKSPKG